jgi:hypothetical protein
MCKPAWVLMQCLNAGHARAQEAGGSEEAIQLAVARAHERMLAAEFAESQAAGLPGGGRGGQAGPRGGGGPSQGSRAAGQAQGAQLRALDAAEREGSPAQLVLPTSEVCMVSNAALRMPLVQLSRV